MRIIKKLKDMELELKHIVPYLPYGLKVKHEGSIETLWSLNYRGGAMMEYSGVCSFPSVDLVKPLLRPLSFMTEKESDELEGIIGCDFYVYASGDDIEIEECVSDPWNGKSILSMSVLNKVYEWLFAHHFDIFGLIDEGLAIDKNTL